jgi:cbb3-type cytochrome oxidase subunit 3
MIREALSHLHWTMLPVVSMLMFAMVFVGVLLWSNRKESRSIYKEMENLPLEENGMGGTK